MIRRRHRTSGLIVQALVVAVLAVLIWQVLPALAVIMTVWLIVDVVNERRKRAGQVPR